MLKPERAPASEIILLAGTQVLIGTNIKLLSTNRVSPKIRLSVGFILFAAGLLTTVAITIDLNSNKKTNGTSETSA